MRRNVPEYSHSDIEVSTNPGQHPRKQLKETRGGLGLGIASWDVRT